MGVVTTGDNKRFPMSGHVWSRHEPTPVIRRRFDQPSVPMMCRRVATSRFESAVEEQSRNKRTRRRIPEV
jgi:hypothetical protein